MYGPAAHPEPGEIGCEHRTAGAERLDQRPQGPAGGEAMDEHDRCRLELRCGAVRVCASLELAGNPDEDAVEPGVRPAAVDPVATRYVGHRRGNIAANSGNLLTTRYGSDRQRHARAEMLEQRL